MCPRCREPMVAFELEGIEIDQCLECRGVWLDGGELETITERAGVDAGPLTQAVHQQTKRGRRTDLKCPRCGRRMLAIELGDAQPVELDRCPLEHGLWFDAGEMGQLIEQFHQGEAGEVARFMADLFGHDSVNHSKGETI